MISNLRAQGATLVVLALFAVAGFTAVCWVAAGWAERAADWWRDRREPRTDEDREGPAWFDGEAPVLELPPERTWEQMTSHQLPLEPHPYGLVRGPSGQTYLGVERERRAPWWEAEQRQAYEALGFDYPSGLMARVRELTP